MEIENMHLKPIGFVKDMAYTANILEFFEEYRNSFGNAESLNLRLEEIPYPMLSFKRESPFNFSEDGREVKLYFSTQKYYDRLGKVTSTPTPIEIYQGLRVFMDRAVQKYNERFR